MLRYVVCGEQTAARCSAAGVQPLAAGPYVPFSPSVPLSLTLALILSLSDSTGSGYVTVTALSCHRKQVGVFPLLRGG